MILTRSSSRNCKMIFIIGRGFAERQILKKWKWPYLLNWVEYFDKLLRKHWYWQDLAQKIAKWYFPLIEALPSSRFWKSDTGAISCTEWNIVMNFCIYIGIDNVPHEIVKWHLRLVEFLPRFKFWKSETIAKWHLSSVEALPSAKFWKGGNSPISWTEWNILIDLCVNSKFWKCENGPWTERNIVMKFCIHIGILTRCSPWEYRMAFGIGRGFAEVQILKKSEN